MKNLRESTGNLLEKTLGNFYKIGAEKSILLSFINITDKKDLKLKFISYILLD